MNMLFILFPALLLLSCASAKPVIVSLPGRSVQLRGEVADFGYQFDQAASHPSNLMLAPVEDPYLCSYPPSLENAPPRNASSPITLLVSRGECPFETKAKVALALQQNFSGGIQYVIIYNNDPNDPSQVIRMGAEGLDVPTLGFVAISTRAGTYTLSSVLYYADTTDQSPYLSTNETEWSYPMDIEEFRSYSGRGAGPGSNTFYVLRFVLFALLILAPCLRAMYLWYNGGGRIAFRRNERGRITGLQYVRPTPYWFAPSAHGQGRQERARLLTEEQVNSLPEIIFAKPANMDGTDDDESTESSVVPVEPMDSDKSQAEPLSPAVEHTSAVDSNNDEPTFVIASHDDEEQQGHSAEASANNEEAPQSSSLDAACHDLTTSCTTCSICIDDFEDGERIRLLPKCKHAFHTDCLMPWLTERQGCCPLCKRSVLGPDEDDSEDEEHHPTEEGSHQEQHLGARVATEDQEHTQREEGETPSNNVPQGGVEENSVPVAEVSGSRRDVRPGDPPV